MTEPTGPTSTGEEPATYDVRGAQERWLKVWEELDPFRAGVREGAEKRTR